MWKKSVLNFLSDGILAAVLQSQPSPAQTWELITANTERHCEMSSSTISNVPVRFVKYENGSMWVGGDPGKLILC